jgi:hypothetical protein
MATLGDDSVDPCDAPDRQSAVPETAMSLNGMGARAPVVAPHATGWILGIVAGAGTGCDRLYTSPVGRVTVSKGLSAVKRGVADRGG